MNNSFIIAGIGFLLGAKAILIWYLFFRTPGKKTRGKEGKRK